MFILFSFANGSDASSIPCYGGQFIMLFTRTLYPSLDSVITKPIWPAACFSDKKITLNTTLFKINKQKDSVINFALLYVST